METTKRLHFHFSLSCIGERNGNPLQCSCLENPRDRGAWWAAIYGVAQSRTRLKRLSSSSSSLQSHQKVWRRELKFGSPEMTCSKIAGQPGQLLLLQCQAVLHWVPDIRTGYSGCVLGENVLHRLQATSDHTWESRKPPPLHGCICHGDGFHLTCLLQILGFLQRESGKSSVKPCSLQGRKASQGWMRRSMWVLGANPFHHTLLRFPPK